MHEYLKWGEQTITDFSEEKVASLYNDGFVFTRKSRGAMEQTRSLRVDLSQFEVSSENRRILRKFENMELIAEELPKEDYDWKIGKLVKDFYQIKFGAGTFSANKAKELLTQPEKSNFNTLFVYIMDGLALGFCIAHVGETIMHYSYPFYDLGQSDRSMGLGMMTMAIMAAKEEGLKYIYLGSASRPNDTYKLQFTGLEWFNKDSGWSSDLEALKSALK